MPSRAASGEQRVCWPRAPRWRQERSIPRPPRTRCPLAHPRPQQARRRQLRKTRGQSASVPLRRWGALDRVLARCPCSDGTSITIWPVAAGLSSLETRRSRGVRSTPRTFLPDPMPWPGHPLAQDAPRWLPSLGLRGSAGECRDGKNPGSSSPGCSGGDRISGRPRAIPFTARGQFPSQLPLRGHELAHLSSPGRSTPPGLGRSPRAG